MIQTKLNKGGINVFAHNFDTNDKDIFVNELILLIYYKTGKKPPSKSNKTALKIRWNEVKNATTTGHIVWDNSEEEELEKLKTEEITIPDTEVGRQAKDAIRSACAAFRVLPPEVIQEELTSEQLEAFKSAIQVEDVVPIPI